VLVAFAALWPVDAFAQHGHGQAQGRSAPAGRPPSAVGRGTAGGPSHATPPPSGGRYAVPRTHPPYYPGHGHYPGYPNYGWGWGWGGYYYPPFVSLYGWYPYPFGGWYPGYPYYGFGPYDATASVRVQVTPREAEVYVDGYYAGVVDDFDGTFQRLRLLPGAHEITIYMPGYRSATERMYFRPNGGYKVSHTLEKLAAGQPDDPKPQPAPQAASPVRQGGERDPYEPVPGLRAPEPRWPDPVGGEPRPVPPAEPSEARRAPAAPFGSLVVRVQPEGASVVIDGERWQGPEGADRLVVQLADGRHRVEIRRDGYAPYSADVDVRAGESTVLNVSLPPADQR
jgi:hypothetical protein